MKKVLLLSLLIFAGATLANAMPIDPGAINAIQTFQGQSVHDMNSIRQQRFRYEEYNEMKDMKEQKEKKNRELQSEDPAIKRIFNRKPTSDNVQFKEENGQIIIESSN